MKRRITSMLLAAAMTITMLTGCGSQGKETEKTDTGAIVLDMYHSWSTDSERGAALDIYQVRCRNCEEYCRGRP